MDGKQPRHIDGLVGDDERVLQCPSDDASMIVYKAKSQLVGSLDTGNPSAIRADHIIDNLDSFFDDSDSDTNIYNLSGSENYRPKVMPEYNYDHTFDYSTMEVLRCDGGSFHVRIQLLLQFRFFRRLLSLPRPVDGWNIPGVRRSVFAVLVASMASVDGLAGTEPTINLPRLVSALQLAIQWGLSIVITKLRFTIWRYIQHRILRYHPFGVRKNAVDGEAVMDESYFIFRSQELYRAWKLVFGCPFTENVLAAFELPLLVSLVVPKELWVGILTGLDKDFVYSVETIDNERHSYMTSEESFTAVSQQYMLSLDFWECGYFREQPLLPICRSIGIRPPSFYRGYPVSLKHLPGDKNERYPLNSKVWEVDARTIADDDANQLAHGRFCTVPSHWPSVGYALARK
ncbi:hypothetical protein DCS_06436 [Drechmeria coniospora]|uniref:Uncharacterized protein n=1 Tax=Drechmeria coniospora TaxID=98403 RepID=A0A151GBJ8_DRECN|nr:hypothetical protein DCS_06436 [Drechmeria coniospora]KYK54478.1 hypothetical protein DCS_06436 [Drechmeria coniospora]